MKLSQEKNIVAEIVSIMDARAERTLVSFYYTKITSDRSWFLEYKLTRVNSVPHRRPLSILWALIDIDSML